MPDPVIGWIITSGSNYRFFYCWRTRWFRCKNWASCSHYRRLRWNWNIWGWQHYPNENSNSLMVNTVTPSPPSPASRSVQKTCHRSSPPRYQRHRPAAAATSGDRWYSRSSPPFSNRAHMSSCIWQDFVLFCIPCFFFPIVKIYYRDILSFWPGIPGS
jgi:hypothetical protein